MKSRLLLLLSIFFLVVSCQNDDGGDSIVVKERKDIALSRSEEQLANESSEFAFRLFQQINSTEQRANWMVSPFSASMALGMMSNGAAGNTLEEMKSTLGFSDFNIDGMNAYYQKLIAELLDLDNTVQLNIANSIWIDQLVHVYDSFADVNEKMYDAQVNSLDFNSPEASNIINDWVANKTNYAIDNISATIPKGAMAASLNALHFKGL